MHGVQKVAMVSDIPAAFFGLTFVFDSSEPKHTRWSVRNILRLMRSVAKCPLLLFCPATSTNSLRKEHSAQSLNGIPFGLAPHGRVVCVCVCVCVCVPTVLQGRSRLVIQSQVRKKGSLNVCPHQPGIRMAAAEEHGASITRRPPWREQHKTTTLLSLHQPRRIAMATDPNYNLHSSKGTINSFPRRGVIATVSSACPTRRKAKYSFRFFLGRASVPIKFFPGFLFFAAFF